MYTTVFTAHVHGPCTSPYTRPCLHERTRAAMSTTVYRPCTRLCTGRVDMAVDTSVYTILSGGWAVSTAVYGPCTRCRVHGRVGYTARTRRSTRSCTRPVHGRVHGPCTRAVGRRRVIYTCTRPSGVSTAVYTTVSTVVYGPCTWLCRWSCTRPSYTYTCTYTVDTYIVIFIFYIQLTTIKKNKTITTRQQADCHRKQK